ncbi:dimethylhistidine N-methyltransferase [Nitrosospira multiformis]|jgi:dimethylhistidine N-methyltransferase|uniref:Dimethylhistidine N-methyltransferase n=1 Tax=Nitrosospira multiformis TaxID=1231 RepID=A0A2T5IA81_9PROT|nr:L-histidine N(alpha)-methyltransferase [Nitrosospira multiformis]PTQ80721.1 dimethylhistidine N-methyltransferase [Nitrosospira multiformis]
MIITSKHLHRKFTPAPLPSIAEDVLEGFSRTPKSLPPKLLYDAAGSALFEQITCLPEYYPTRTEAGILTAHAEEICSHLRRNVSVSELGAGTATKTRILLRSLVQRQFGVNYFPLDVSDAALKLAKDEVESELGTVKVHPQVGDFDNLTFLEHQTPPRLVLYIGSSIGNLENDEAIALLQNIARNLSTGDKLLLGADLVKDAEVMHAAYDDDAGVTASFNKNLLVRINRELGGHFDPESFCHISFWNEAESRIELHLESACRQSVRIDALDMTLQFDQGERIHTENSYKYTVEHLENLLRSGGFRVEHTWTDPDSWFAVSLGVIT